MALQPIKKGGPYQKPRSKTVKKRNTSTKSKKQTSSTAKKGTTTKRTHPKYGTSKLEKRFECDFLKKLGVKYERQFYASDIKRYYDFYLNDYSLIIEIDGTYYHGYGLLYEEMSPMQKRNHRVDQLKNEWAHQHGYRLLRIWEHEINNNPVKVMETLKKTLNISEKKKIIDENKKKRH